MNLLLLALAPAFALAIYFYSQDKYEKEPLSLMIQAFIWGVVITFAAIIVETIFTAIFVRPVQTPVIKIFMESFVVAALVEEGLKFLIFKRFIYRNKNFNEPYDGILYAVMISLGFATLENISYVFSAAAASGTGSGAGVAIGRALFAVPGHALFAVIMGYYLGCAKFSADRQQEQIYIRRGLWFAVLAHGLYDFFLMMRTSLGFFAMIVLSFVCWKIALKAVKIHASQSPFKSGRR